MRTGSRLAIGLFLGLLSLGGGLAACNAVLGIDRATVDPTLGQEGGSGDAGTPCESYCTTIMSACTGPNQEYLSQKTCVAMCTHFEPGVMGDMSGDSLGCRTYHAGAAKGDPDTHCKHAGPLGGGVCGAMPCNAFCLLDTAFCTTAYDGGEVGCRSAACTFTYLTPGTADASDLGLESGDSLNCRNYHMQAAYDPDNQPTASVTHCPHTGIVSAKCQ